MVNSKQKGGSFERDVCKKLSLWVTDGTQEDCFWRSSMSGGRATVAHAKGKRFATQAGDISCIHPSGQKLTDKFVIECKHYKDLQFDGLIAGKGNLVKFWLVICKEAKKYGKRPMLIAKQNNRPTIVCLDYKEASDYLNPAAFFPEHKMAMVRFEEFLKWPVNWL